MCFWEVNMGMELVTWATEAGASVTVLYLYHGDGSPTDVFGHPGYTMQAIATWFCWKQLSFN